MAADYSRFIHPLGPLLIGLAALCGACASMNQGQCETADWFNQGVDDGVSGHTDSRYESYNKDCAEFGVRVDRKAYLSGWEVGIAEYCTANNGYDEGLSGNNYRNSCPTQLQDGFFAAYQLGQRLFDQRSRIDALRYELEEVNDDLARHGLSDEQRAILRRDRRHLKRDIDREQIALGMIASQARSQGFPAPF